MMAQRKTRKRRTVDETRTAMLEAGVNQLAREGVQFGLDHVTLDEACSVADVPRSSSHAAWAFDDGYAPQILYRRSVLQRWISEREGMMFAAAAENALAAAFHANGDALTRGEIVRIAIQAAMVAALEPDENGVGSGFLSSDMALKHALASQPIPARDPQIAEWIHDSEVEQRDQRVEDTYRPLAILLNLQPRPEYGEEAYQHLALAIAALTEGITMRHLVVPERDYANSPIREGDSVAPATLLGVCVESIVETFFEPIDC